ncbi:MAG: hypothetical protein L3K09_03700 [Thermoplasmata archaeon]|nr:hypothetical protein [Thermoplasmata archaeon]
MKHLGRAVVGLSLIALVVGLAAPVSASLGAGSGAHAAVATPALVKAPVYIHFSPKNASGAQGGSVSATAVIKNTGSHTFTATSCKLWYRLGTSGAWTKAASCLTSAYFPSSFAAHKTTKVSGTQAISLTFPTGTYGWKLVLIGTYNGVSEQSHPGILTVTIT